MIELGDEAWVVDVGLSVRSADRLIEELESAGQAGQGLDAVVVH